MSSGIKRKRFTKFRELIQLNPPPDATGALDAHESPELFYYYYYVGIQSVYSDGERYVQGRRYFTKQVACTFRAPYHSHGFE